jgi:hypothetical protein
VALSQNSWKGLRITRKTEFQTDGVAIKIWNKHLQNKVYTHTHTHTHTHQPARALDTVGYNCSCANTLTLPNITWVPQGLWTFQSMRTDAIMMICIVYMKVTIHNRPSQHKYY